MNPALSKFLKYLYMLIPLPNLNPNLTYSTYFELYFEVRAVALNYSHEGISQSQSYGHVVGE